MLQNEKLKIESHSLFLACVCVRVYACENYGSCKKQDIHSDNGYLYRYANVSDD